MNNYRIAAKWAGAGMATRFTAATAERARAKIAEMKKERLALFAEVLSGNGNVRETASVMYIPLGTAREYFRVLKADLGEQAS